MQMPFSTVASRAPRRMCRHQPGNPLVAGEKETNRPRAVTCEQIPTFLMVEWSSDLLLNPFRVRRKPVSSPSVAKPSEAARTLH
jgi:hypothetical protein